MTKEELIKALTVDSFGDLKQEPKREDYVEYYRAKQNYNKSRKRAEKIAERIWPEIEKYLPSPKIAVDQSTKLGVVAGDKVKCLYGNSGHKFHSEIFEPFAVVERIRLDEKVGLCQLQFEGSFNQWWWENDFKKLTTN